MQYKYKQDIFYAIIRVFYEQNDKYKDNTEGPTWTQIYNFAKQHIGRTISYRDFDYHLKNMVNDNILHKKDSGRRGTSVSFSLTKNANKQYYLKILGVDEETQRRKKLYQVLFFFQALKPPKLISAKMLNKILSKLSLSKNDLTTETHFHILATGYAETNYKPVNDYKFRIVDVYDQGKKLTLYYYKHMGFSLKDIILYIKKQQKAPEDETKPIPFINQIRFTEATGEEVKKAFDTLRQENLIRSVQNIFDGHSIHITYIISDDSLQDLLNKIWRIHDLEFEMLQKKWSYLEGPTQEEKEWLKLAYGGNEASMIIHNVSRFRKEYRKKNKNNNEHLAHMKLRIETLQDRIDQLILNINRKYGSIIQKLDFPLNILEDICMRKIFLN